MFINTLQNILTPSNNEQAILNNGPLREAQRQSDLIMATKQREPMTIEWADSIDNNNNITWKSITMYINPNKISFQQNKVTGKQITRGGIFYQMWGEDFGMLTLSGYTGLSGMKGIQQIEEFYHASNTLLAYKPPGLNYVDNVNAPAYNGMSFEGPVDAIQTAFNTTDHATLDYCSSQINSFSGPVANASTIASSLYNTYTNRALAQAEMADAITNAVTNLQNWHESYMSINNAYPNRQLFYQQALQQFTTVLSSTHPDIITTLATQATNDFYSGTIPVDMIGQNLINNITLAPISPFIGGIVGSAAASNISALTSVTNGAAEYYDSLIAFQPAEWSLQTQIIENNEALISQLQDYLTQLQNYEKSVSQFNETLRNDIVNTQFVDFSNKWEPRRVIIYFEDRAYVGFFQNFGYNRDAATNLVTYNLQFVVQYQFLAGTQAPANTSTTKVWSMADQYGNITTGTDYNAIVNQHNGQWLNHQWVPGHYINGVFVKNG